MEFCGKSLKVGLGSNELCGMLGFVEGGEDKARGMVDPQVTIAVTFSGWKTFGGWNSPWTTGL